MRTDIGAALCLLFSASLLGGCLVLSPSESSNPLPPLLYLSGRDPCDPRLVANCDEVEADVNAPYRVRPLEMNIHQAREQIIRETGSEAELLKPDAAALTIAGLNRDVVVDGFDAMGFHIGILVRDVDCPSCTVTLRNLTISEDNEYINRTGRPVSMQGPIIATMVRDSTVNVRIEHASFYLREYSGNPEDIFSPEGWTPGARGIELTAVIGAIVIENVTIDAPSQTMGTGIRIDLGGQVWIRDAKVRNHRDCVRIEGGMVNVDHAQLRDCGVGIRVDAYMPGRPFLGLDLANFLIEDAETIGLIPTPPAPFCPPFEQLLWQSVLEEPPLRVSIRDGTVLRSGTAGLGTSFPVELAIERVEFRDNGHSPIDDNVATGGIINPCAWATVRESSFDGNHGHGYWGHAHDDIRWNWWGHAGGPSVQPSPAGPPIGEGDAIGGLAYQYAPFLTEPPG